MNISRLLRHVPINASNAAKNRIKSVITTLKNEENTPSQDAKRKIPSVPMSRRKVVSWLRSEIYEHKNRPEKQKFETFIKELDNHLTSQSRNELRLLKYRYDPFDPDRRDKLARNAATDGSFDLKYMGDSEREIDSFLTDFDKFVKRGNFYRLSESELNDQVLASVITQDGLNINVDRKDYSTIAVWVSGVKPEQPPPPIRNIFEFFKEFYLFIEYYTYGLVFRLLYNVVNLDQLFARITGKKDQRFEYKSNENYNLVIIAIREKDTRDLILKAFRDIPTNYINRLIPNASPSVNSVDMLAFLSTATFAAYQCIEKDHQWWLLLLLVNYRLYYRYRYAANNHQKNLAQILFYKNIANNQPLIGSLCDRAIDEQFKCQILTYSVILHLQNSSYKYANGVNNSQILSFFRKSRADYTSKNNSYLNVTNEKSETTETDRKMKVKLQESYFDMYDSEKAIKHACRNLVRTGVLDVQDGDISDKNSEMDWTYRACDFERAIENIRVYEATKMMDQSVNPNFDFMQFYRNDNLEEGELRDTYVKEPIGMRQKYMNKIAYKFFIGRRND